MAEESPIRSQKSDSSADEAVQYRSKLVTQHPGGEAELPFLPERFASNRNCGKIPSKVFLLYHLAVVVACTYALEQGGDDGRARWLVPHALPCRDDSDAAFDPAVASGAEVIQ